MPEIVHLGIDTSCYTTSLAVIDDRGDILHDQRLLLPVAAGEHGLRQSEGVFHHVRQLPELLRQVPLSSYRLRSIGVSSQPRPLPGSYMPVFLAGLVVAQAVASANGLPVYEFSHQEGHIAAGLQPALVKTFLAVHLSGGTSELLRVTPHAQAGFSLDRLAGTNDLSAGQMIDRIGVALGLPFPAGPDLERLARPAAGRLPLPSAVDGLCFSFSGPCAAAERLVRQGEEPTEIAFAVLRVIANTLEKVLRAACREYRTQTVLLVGGVMSNQLIRDRLCHRLGPAAELLFAAPHLSSDNAVGIARLARQRHQLSQPGV